jgi:hypothetical protein
MKKLKITQTEIRVFNIITKLLKKFKRIPTYAEVSVATGYAKSYIGPMIIKYKKINKIKTPKRK